MFLVKIHRRSRHMNNSIKIIQYQCYSLRLCCIVVNMIQVNTSIKRIVANILNRSRYRYLFKSCTPPKHSTLYNLQRTGKRYITERGTLCKSIKSCTFNAFGYLKRPQRRTFNERVTVSSNASNSAYPAYLAKIFYIQQQAYYCTPVVV